MDESKLTCSTPPKNVGTSQFQLQTEAEKEKVVKSCQRSYFYGEAKDHAKLIQTHIENTETPKSKIKKMGAKEYFQQYIQSNHQQHAFTLVMNNLGQDTKNFTCSCSVNTLVKVFVSQFKEIQIKNIAQTQTLFYFNFHTIDASIQMVHNSSLILNICQRIILEFEDLPEISENNIQKLHKILQYKINNSLGHIYQMKDLIEVQNFQKKKYKSLPQFDFYSQTGDILLTQSQRFMSKLQRLFTNSQYDHVCMIYRNSDFTKKYKFYFDYFIFQSNSKSGVCISPFHCFLKNKWYQSLNRFVWRSLNNLNRTPHFQQQIGKLILSKLGKTYQISIDKLISKQSVIYSSIQDLPTPSLSQPGQSQKLSQKSTQIGFFCSQLVAFIYKDMKLLTRDTKQEHFKPSCNYLPYHFSQKFNLNLLEGNLSDEYILHFNQSVILEYEQFF